MKALQEEVQPVETHTNGASENAAPVLRAVPAPVEVAPGVFLAPGRKRTGQEANEYLLAKNAELYRRLAK